MSNTKALLNDIFDYLMENNFDIGTNFKEEFSNSYVAADVDNVIVLFDKNKNYVGKIILKLEPKYK